MSVFMLFSQGLHSLTAHLPLRWRLALVSFGLLAILLAALGVLVSLTEEQVLISNQAGALRDQAFASALLFSNSGQGIYPVTPDPANTVISANPAKVKFNAKGQKPFQFGDISPSQVSRLPYLVKPLSAPGAMTNPGSSVSIISTRGTILVSSIGSPIILGSDKIRRLVTWPLPDTIYTQKYDSQGRRQLVVLLPLAENQSIVAFVQMTVPSAPMDRTVTTLRLILAFGILAALCIAAIFTLPLISIVLRPFVQMEQVSLRIAAGALWLRLDEPSTHDEIGRLARAFNHMIARLESAFTRQKRFVADVSHELRTPLTSLGGSLEMLLWRATDEEPEAAQRLLNGMYAEVARMQRLVLDLLVLARLDEGHLKLREEAVDAHALVSDVCEQVRELVYGQTLCCHRFPPDLPSIRGDADQLKRVLINVVENALRFTPPAGRVELSACCEPGQIVTLKIHDTGSGIPPEDLPRIFDRFYRVDPSRTRSFGPVSGSGLGLSIAQELVEAHGGTIAITSALNQGTTVTIRLPAISSVSA